MKKKKNRTLTPKLIEDFNRMRFALIKISKVYMTPAQLRKGSQADYGLDFEEALEMTYDNLQYEAHSAVKRVRKIEP